MIRWQLWLGWSLCSSVIFTIVSVPGSGRPCFQWLTLEEDPAASAGAQVMLAFMNTSRTVHVTSLLHQLRWLTVCFWAQFKMLVLTFKSLPDMKTEYLRDCLFLVISACPIRFVREGMLLVPSVIFHRSQEICSLYPGHPPYGTSPWN